MKKILVVSMSAELGGIEKSLIIFLKYLIKNEFQVDLLLWKKRGELLLDIPKEVVILDSPAPGNFKNIIKNIQFKNFIKYVKLKLFTKFNVPWKSFPKLSDNYDVAISYTQDGYSPYYVIDNVKATKKYLWYHHGAYINYPNKRKNDLKYYKKYNNIVTVSESNKIMLSSHFNDIADKILIVPNLIDEEEIINKSNEYCTMFRNYNGCKIVTVGRLSEEKGQLRMLKVCKELKERGFDFKWCFVGEGPLRTECENYIKYNNLENNCYLVGGKKNPYKYMRNADLYIQLSNIESDGITIQEALILNKIILASDIPTFRETLINGSLGKICSNNEEIIKSIYDLNANTILRDKYFNNIKNRDSRNAKVMKMLDKLFE